MNIKNFISELKRRNVIRVATAYGIAGWLIIQIATSVFPAFNFPDWTSQFVIILTAIGFPIALIIAWAFELTPEGLKKTHEVKQEESITPQTGKKINHIIIACLSLLVLFLITERLFFANNLQRMPENVDKAATEAKQASIAVLPFDDLSPKADQGYFADGIAEEILNVLVDIPDLSVASRTSSFAFKNQDQLGIPYIAEELKVRYVLEGSVRKAGENLRITAQLIDASTDQHIWSNTYDRVLSTENIFAIQDEIARSILEALSVTLQGDKTFDAALAVSADTENLSAYELFLRGREQFLIRSNVNLPGTISIFERAVELDPGFARAWSGLAAAYAVSPSWGLIDREYFELAEKAALRAMELNPQLSLPYAVLGRNLTRNDQALTAENARKSLEYLDKAILIDARNTTAILWRGIEYMDLGYFDKAEVDLNSCLAIDPGYENCRRHLALVKMFKGEQEESFSLFYQSLLAGSRSWDQAFALAFASLGRYEEASLCFAMDLDGEIMNVQKLIDRYTNPDFDFETEAERYKLDREKITGEPFEWASNPIKAIIFKKYKAIEQSTEKIVHWFPYDKDWNRSIHRKNVIRYNGLPDYWKKYGYPAQCKPVGENDFTCSTGASGIALVN